MSSKSSSSSLSQLALSDKWGRSFGDVLCGPLCVYLLASAKKKRTVQSFKSFLRKSFPEFLVKGKRSGIFSEEICDFFNSYKENSATLVHLHRARKQKDLIKDTAKLLQSALKEKKQVVMDIECHFAEVVDNSNKWTRAMGHFVVLLSVNPKRVKDGYIEFEYWDPWNGKSHWGILREERFRDFLPERDGKVNLVNALRRSSSGHSVISPYLCLEMPQLDMYDPDVYFAQRVVYLLKNVCLVGRFKS